MSTTQQHQIEVKDLPQVHNYLISLDLLEKVSGYDEWTKKSWTVTHTIQEQVGEYWVDIELYAKWEKDTYESGPELVEFEVENVVVSKDDEEIFGRADCVIYMNNPLQPSYKENTLGSMLNDVFKGIFDAQMEGIRINKEINEFFKAS